MKIQKRFDINVSKRFPDGSIASMHLGTLQEFDMEDPNLEKEAHAELAKRVYDATQRDLKRLVKTDPLAESIWRSVIQQLSHEDKVRKAEKKLRDEE